MAKRFTKLLAVVALGGCQLEPIQPVQKPAVPPSDAGAGAAMGATTAANAGATAQDAGPAVMAPRRLRSGRPAPGNLATRAAPRDDK